MCIFNVHGVYKSAEFITMGSKRIRRHRGFAAQVQQAYVLNETQGACRPPTKGRDSTATGNEHGPCL